MMRRKKKSNTGRYWFSSSSLVVLLVIAAVAVLLMDNNDNASSCCCLAYLLVFPQQRNSYRRGAGTKTTTTTTPLIPISSSPPPSREQQRDIILDATAKEEDLRPSSSAQARGPEQESLSSSSSNKWNNFDYNEHWYPVIWVNDLKPNQPTKITLFDIDYVVAIDDAAGKNQQKITTALRDCCPHKGAALSEGRMMMTTTTGKSGSSSFIQCAYHGWSFNGTTGACHQIPQASAASPSIETTKTSNSNFSKRTCAQSIPATIHQGMVWLWPGPPRSDSSSYPLPPTVPEMDDPQFVVTRVVRDFPMVDWTLLMSNILDPDHGVFAHQAGPFDMYSASKDYPLHVEEDFTTDKNNGWTLKTTVPAVKKLLKVDQQRRQQRGKKKNTKDDDSVDAAAAAPTATSIFYAPTVATLGRRNQTDGSTSFITAFWVCPTGTGKSRFLSASTAKIPKFIKIPRWFFHINLNNFLDQDTMLVASQQPAVLTAEAQGRGRSSVFAYASPTDRSVRLIDQFWDATTAKAPNRAETLQELYKTGQLRHTPDRRIVLDREVQHLKICPDSQDAVRNCRRIRNGSLAVLAGWLGRAFWERSLLQLSKGQWAIGVVAVLTAYLSENIRKRFYFFYPESKRNRDLKTIPTKMWLDPSDG